jgi:hypothetical protein
MTAMCCNDLTIGRKVYYTTDQEFSFLATIVDIETNYEIGVRYYRIRLLEDGTLLNVRAGEIFPAY